MPITSDPQTLDEITLFNNLSLEHLTWLNQHLQASTFPAGSNIALVGQPGEVVYVIYKGTVKIYVEQLNGTNVILAILGPGDVVGEMSIVDSIGRSANIVALEKSTLLWMDRTMFRECLQSMPPAAQNLEGILSRRLRRANEHIQALATLDIYGRVARQILAFAQQYGQMTADGDILIPIRLTQSDMADLVGATRERVNRIMVSYKQLKYISTDRSHRITVHNRPELAQRCQ